MTRTELTEKIVAAKMAKGLTWTGLADKMGLSKEFATAALLGQMSLSKEEAETAGGELGLSAEEILLLQQVPYRGALGQTVPTDPLIYRFYEISQVYGTAIKAVIEEEFGDGIMSAIDFTVDVSRQPDPKGDRAVVTLNGKFLPYKKF